LGLVQAQPTIAPDQGGDAAGKNLSIARFEAPPVIDGKLDDAVWSSATVIDDLHQMNPVEYAAPSQRTEIVAYDDDALYVRPSLYTDPTKSRPVYCVGEGPVVRTASPYSRPSPRPS
jgi:hypothetical protein